jgi:Ca2+/Na+ antiporter
MIYCKYNYTYTAPLMYIYYWLNILYIYKRYAKKKEVHGPKDLFIGHYSAYNLQLHSASIKMLLKAFVGFTALILRHIYTKAIFLCCAL